MIWTRGTVGGLIMHLGTSIDALLIILFSAFALKSAMAKKFKIHERWAMRLFIAVGGVWFFRVGLMFWILINQGPVGFDPNTFTGPFLSFWTFGQYLLPLAILELYYFAYDRGSKVGKIAMAIGIMVATLATCIGVFGATIGMWFSRI